MTIDKSSRLMYIYYRLASACRVFKRENRIRNVGGNSNPRLIAINDMYIYRRDGSFIIVSVFDLDLTIIFVCLSVLAAMRVRVVYLTGFAENMTRNI